MRTILITGGGTGIGLAISTQFLTLGDNVFICQHRQEDLDNGIEECGRFGERVSGIVGDISVDSVCQEAVDACVERFGGLDVLVNNAAITGPCAIGDFWSADDAQMTRIVDVNLKAAYRCSRYACAEMINVGRRGVIVNVGSVASFVAQQDAVAYTMTKAGLLGLTRALALELAKYDIRAVMVAPGDIDTVTSSNSEYLSAKNASSWSRAIPMGNRGTPQQVADTVVYLCSDAASYITGTSVIIDGGMLTY